MQKPLSLAKTTTRKNGSGGSKKLEEKVIY